MKKLLLLASIWLAALCPAHAQNVTVRVVATCGAETLPLSPGVTWLRVDQTGTLCSAAGSGGGGGLSVTDNSAWTNASSKFTPGGGVFNDSATALTAGNEGTVRLNANREMHVDCDTNNTICSLIKAPIPAGTNLIGSVTADPCATQLKLNAAIAASTGTIQVVAGVAAKKVYVCGIFVLGASAFVGNMIEGTGAACATANEAAVIGSTTAANGASFSANNGWVQGSGNGTVAVTATAANGICILQSGTVALAGNMTYVQQ